MKKILKSRRVHIITAAIVAVILCVTVSVSAFSAQDGKEPVESVSTEDVQRICMASDSLPNIQKTHTQLLENRIPKYTLSQMYKMDLSKPSGVTAEDLNRVLIKGLSGLGESFLKAEKDYGINAVFLASIAILESGWGTMMFAPNNMFGFMGHSFSSKPECIDFVGKSIAKNYLSPSGAFYHGATVRGVNQVYAGNKRWYVRIAKNMLMLYTQMYENNQKQLKLQ